MVFLSPAVELWTRRLWLGRPRSKVNVLLVRLIYEPPEKADGCDNEPEPCQAAIVHGFHLVFQLLLSPLRPFSHCSQFLDLASEPFNFLVLLDLHFSIQGRQGCWG